MARWHRWNAALLALFLTFHFANHLFLWGGIDRHIAVMQTLRTVYRQPVIEIVLLALFAAQIGIGAGLVVRRGRPRGGWAWAQVLSGAVIVVFVAQHVTAALMARWQFPQMGTDAWWAASVVSGPPFVWYFAPYYVLGVWAVFVHVAAALRFRAWPQDPPRLSLALPVIGLVFAISIVAALMAGARDGLPPENRAYLDSFGF